MPETPLKNILNFALEKLPGEPLQRRANLYRDLAKIVGDELAARTLNKLATDLEQIEARHRQLWLGLE